MYIYEIIAVSMACIIMSLYLTAYICQVGLPASISATYYRNERKWLFPATVAATALLALVPLMNHTPDEYRFLAFFVVASTLFVASAPAFREEFVGKVHAVSASVLGISAVLWMCLTTGCPWLAVITTVIIGPSDRKHFLFWVEIGLLANIFSSLIWLIAISG